jgi:hypothetical protein
MRICDHTTWLSRCVWHGRFSDTFFWTLTISWSRPLYLMCEVALRKLEGPMRARPGGGGCHHTLSYYRRGFSFSRFQHKVTLFFLLNSRRMSCLHSPRLSRIPRGHRVPGTTLRWNREPPLRYTVKLASIYCGVYKGEWINKYQLEREDSIPRYFTGLCDWVVVVVVVVVGWHDGPVLLIKCHREGGGGLSSWFLLTVW